MSEPRSTKSALDALVRDAKNGALEPHVSDERWSAVEKQILARMATALNCTVDLLVSTLTIPSGQTLARSYKADGKPSAETAATFERLLIDAGVSEEKRTALLAGDN